MGKNNIFIEGIPGSGKSTLLNVLANHFSEYGVFREGEISPLELAWCAYMTKKQYQNALIDMEELKDEIEAKSLKEGFYFITPYTKIQTENYKFYEYMERYEIYGGRITISEFQKNILYRFRRFQTYGNLFECSFFQNIIEELMLFGMFSDEQIVAFYKEIILLLDLSSFKLIRLAPSNIESTIKAIKVERVNENGEETWYSMMINYLSNSPYGKEHKISTFEDMVTHFRRRIELENQIMLLLPEHCLLNIESKKYDINDILRIVKS